MMVVALILFVIQRNDGESPHSQVDYGYAVILSGSVWIESPEGGRKPVGKLGTIPPLSLVEAQETTRLTLQSSLEPSNDVTLVSIYLDSQSKIRIQSVDSTIDSEGQGTRPENFPTSLAYLEGSLLVLRTGGARELKVMLDEVVINYSGVGRMILGIRSSEGVIQVDCLQGRCSCEVLGSEIIQFNNGQSLMISSDSNDVLGIGEILSDNLVFWDDLCGGCLSTQ
jgi:hypothetical protein